MKKVIIAVALAGAVFTSSAQASKVVVRYGPVQSANSTSYCLKGIMADGTNVRGNSVAMNGVPLGTRIRLHGKTRFRGRQFFVVRDRIGHGSQLDFWSPSCHYTWNIWGRRNVKYQIQYKTSSTRIPVRKP